MRAFRNEKFRGGILALHRGFQVRNRDLSNRSGADSKAVGGRNSIIGIATRPRRRYRDGAAAAGEGDLAVFVDCCLNITGAGNFPGVFPAIPPKPRPYRLVPETVPSLVQS